MRCTAAVAGDREALVDRAAAGPYSAVRMASRQVIHITLTVGHVSQISGLLRVRLAAPFLAPWARIC